MTNGTNEFKLVKAELNRLLHKDFSVFLRRAFIELNNGKKLGDEPYLDVLASEVERFAKREHARLIVNLPPRHLKTFTFSVCGSAWILGHDPASRIMIVTNGDKLAKDIMRQIRALLRTRWFREAFSTRLERGHEAVLDFGTRGGGGVYAVSIGGAITGSGGDVIIVDDPLHINDASNLDRLQEVNQFFANVIETRHNAQKHGRIMLVEHRLHRDDLSGYLLARDDDWRHVKLPLIAPRDTTSQTRHGIWARKKGEPLRPNDWDDVEIKKARARCHLPDFETIYQQDPTKGLQPITAEFFSLVYSRLPLDPPPPVVLSIDPGQSGNSHGSYSVIQAWCRNQDGDVLIDQFRERCDYRALRRACKKFIGHHRPSAILVEMTGQGPVLHDDLTQLYSVELIPVRQPSRPKEVRLAKHFKYLKTKRIQLPARADWMSAFIGEFVQFPNGESDDMVDATTQYLDFMATNPVLIPLPPRAIGVMISRGGGQPWSRATSPAPRFFGTWPSRGR